MVRFRRAQLCQTVTRGGEFFENPEQSEHGLGLACGPPASAFCFRQKPPFPQNPACTKIVRFVRVGHRFSDVCR